MKEYSFVNMPSDEHSSVIDKTDTVEESEAEWVTSAKFFVLDMDKEGPTIYTF